MFIKKKDYIQLKEEKEGLVKLSQHNSNKIRELVEKICQMREEAEDNELFLRDFAALERLYTELKDKYKCIVADNNKLRRAYGQLSEKYINIQLSTLVEQVAADKKNQQNVASAQSTVVEKNESKQITFVLYR